MTREELLADIDKATQSFAARIMAQTQESSGIPRTPKIEVSESSIKTNPLNFELDGEPTAQAAPGSGGGTPTPSDCPPAPCHVIGEIHLAVEGDRYGSCAFFVDDDFTVTDPTHLRIDLQTTMVIRKTSDDTSCGEVFVNLAIQAVCSDALWHLQITGTIQAWTCPFEDCVITDSVIVTSESEELGTLPQDVELTLSGTYTCGTVSGTATLTISETCGVYGVCCFPCPDTTTPSSQRTEAGCIAIGGEWQGEGTTECPPKTGGCYIADVCTIMTEADCTLAGGEYDADCTTCP